MQEQIQTIITEWLYRLPTGIPKVQSDYEVLRDVLQEQTELTAFQIESIVRRASGISEQTETTDWDEDPIISQTTISYENFTNLIYSRYTVENQSIIGLESMYRMIQDHPRQNEISNLIFSKRQKSLKSGIYPIRGVDELLYDIIAKTIKIPNGDYSELWFAIIYDGKVAGAVAGESGIEADIEVGDENVSLKNYDRTTFDFGSLDPESTEQMNSFLELSKLLTGNSIPKTKGRNHINEILGLLENPDIDEEIQTIIDMRETTNIRVLQRIGDKINDLLNSHDDANSLVTAFCKNIDIMLKRKISTVGWWGMIIKGNKTLFLETADDIFESIRCKDNRLSPAIANFHMNKLFVLGSNLSTRVTKKPIGETKR
jgi:hypothetical protein